MAVSGSSSHPCVQHGGGGGAGGCGDPASEGVGVLVYLSPVAAVTDDRKLGVLNKWAVPC